MVEVNPQLLAFILGEDQKAVEGALERLCSPDVKSRKKAEGGRRLVKEGEYIYRVVNAEHFDKVRNELDRMEKDRIRKQVERAQARASQDGEHGKTGEMVPMTKVIEEMRKVIDEKENPVPP